KEKATNLMAHALLSAVEFQITGKDPLTGAMAGITGEATAQYLTKALYNKAPSELTASEKETISSLSQLAGGLAGAFTAKANGSIDNQGGSVLTAVAGAETAKRAVENNYLSVLSQKRRDEIREKIKNGQASRKEIVEYLQYEKADQTSDYLVDKARHRPEEMTSQEWAEYENYAKHYVSESIQNRELPQNIERDIKEILAGNYYKGYGYAYALDEKYRSNLPSRWFISDSDKSAEEKMYENLNAKYIQNPRTLRESFNGRVAESTKEGLELAATLYTGNILTATGLSVANKLGPVGKQLATTAEKYPLLTDIGTTAIANTAYQLSQNKPYDPYSLLQSELSTVLTRGKTLGQQLSINVGISTMATENPDDYGWNALGAFTGTVGTKIMSQANFNKNNSQFLKSVITGTIAEGIGDPTNLKQQYKNIKDIKNENLKE
ncbi:VENN motif pre-toxin domain-containing protein, partial [Avibacterium avium]|uniref:VENN motif pre-toxin domain-containing protein n=2 Tax=Avibacterium avium TaxID=751 RepID=UPI003BF7FCB1